MGYEGYLVKIKGVGDLPDYIISTKRFIKANAYSVLRSGQDLDSYRDENGNLHRTALAHFLYKIEFETVPMLKDEDVQELMSAIRDRYISTAEKSVIATFYMPELGHYVTYKCYVPDIQFSIYGNYNHQLHYNSFRVALISY